MPPVGLIEKIYNKWMMFLEHSGIEESEIILERL